MDDTICYLNTDLELASVEDLTALSEAFKIQGVFPLYVTQDDGAGWHATFETYEHLAEPEHAIDLMLAVVESLDGPIREVWSRCTQREFNIGYDCGSKPWAFSQGLSSALLGRIAAAGDSLRLTLYPPESEKKP